MYNDRKDKKREAHEGFSEKLQWNVQNVMGDEHKGIIKWMGDIGTEHGLCFVHKSGEIFSKY